MAPYMCYTHHGLYEVKPNGDDGCNNAECLAFARKVVRPVGIHYTGHGGSAATKISRADSKKFHADMYAYKDAVKDRSEEHTSELQSR